MNLFGGRTIALILVLAGLPAVSDGAAPEFEERLIADKYGYTFGVAAHDFDGDGDLDLSNVDIVGKNPSDASLLLWENDGRGGLTRHVIHDDENGWLERHCLGDINGDGRTDIAVVSNRDGLLLWFEHPGREFRGRWQRRVITTSCPHAYDVSLGDFDGDGDLDAASAGYVSNTLAWYENPGRDGLDAEWKRQVIDQSLSENRTVVAVDFNQDGRIDLLAASVGRAFTAADPVVPPSDHGAAVVWFENTGRSGDERWTKRTIDDQTRGAIHGHPVDLDRDGDLDVVMAFGMRPEHVPEDRHEIAWYENLGRPQGNDNWQRHVVATMPCAFEAIAGDLDNDGDLDLAATAWSKGDRVVWFENAGDPRADWQEHLLKDRYYAANQVIAADLDGDGRLDVIASSDDGSRRVQGALELRWWRNLGAK